MKTMSSITNQVQACLYPTTIINKHHLCFQSKSNVECLFAKKKRLSIRKQDVFQVPHCTISSSSSSPESKNNQDDKNFNVASWITLFNGNGNEAPSKSKDGHEAPLTSALLPHLLFNNDPKKMIMLWMVSNAKEYIGKHLYIKMTKHAGRDALSVFVELNIGTWKGIDLNISYDLDKVMNLRNARIVLQPLACLKLKVEEIIVLLLEKIAPSAVHNVIAKAALFNLLLSLLFMVISLILWMNTSV